MARYADTFWCDGCGVENASSVKNVTARTSRKSIPPIYQAWKASIPNLGHKKSMTDFSQPYFENAS